MGELAGEELEEAVQLVEVAARRRHERRRILVGGLERPHLELEAVAKPLHPPEHAHGVALGEPLVEELDVAPDPGLDAPARIDELEGEIGAAAAGAQAPLARDGEEPVDDPVLGELRDRHGAILGPATDGSLARRWPS